MHTRFGIFEEFCIETVFYEGVSSEGERDASFFDEDFVEFDSIGQQDDPTKSLQSTQNVILFT